MLLERFVYPSRILPDVEMYAGDTSPWLVWIMDDEGNHVPYEDVAMCIMRLSISPIKLTTSIGYQAPFVKPEIELIAVPEKYTDGSAVVPIFWNLDDTINMRGSYMYQLDCWSATDRRVCQGVLVIKQNMDRE